MAEAQKVELGAAPPELRAAPPGDLPKIDTLGAGGTFLQRAGASIPLSPEGRVSYLESVFGSGNVITSGQGEIFVRDPKQGNAFAPFDERGFSLKDVTADIVGPAIQAAPTLLAGSNPLTVAGAGAVGSLARQGVAELLPGQENLSFADRAVDVGVSGLLAGGAQAFVNVGAKVFDALRPHNLIARQVKKATDKPFAKEGARLSKETGIPLSLGEETGNRATLMVEAIGRRTPGAADNFFEFHQGQLQTSMLRLQQSMDELSPTGLGDLEIGTHIINAFDDAVNSAKEIRRAQAAVDFGELGRVSNNQPLIPAKALVARIQSLVDELDVPGAGDATARMVKQARTLRDSLLKDDAPAMLTGEQAQRLLQVYTNAQSGTGIVFRDMEKSQSRFVAARLKDALLEDVDAAVVQAGQSGQVAEALKVARDHYRLNSVALNEIADSTLARLIGSRTASPEAIAEKFVTKLRPSEVASSMKIIEAVKPETAMAVRRHFIETAILNAKPAASQQAAAGVKFSSAKFLSNLPEEKILRAAGFPEKTATQLGDVAKALERVSDKAFEGSPTAPLHITWDIVRGFFTLNPVTLGRAGGAILAPRAIARASLTPEGRAALIQLSTTGAPTKKALQALSTLQAIIAIEPATGNIRPIDAQGLRGSDTQEGALAP